MNGPARHVPDHFRVLQRHPQDFWDNAGSVRAAVKAVGTSQPRSPYPTECEFLVTCTDLEKPVFFGPRFRNSAAPAA